MLCDIEAQRDPTSGSSGGFFCAMSLAVKAALTLPTMADLPSFAVQIERWMR